MILHPFLPKEQDKNFCRITCMGVFEGLNSVRYFAYQQLGSIQRNLH